MERELTSEAFALLEYLIKNEDKFNTTFNASQISHRKGNKVDYIKPLLQELTSFNLLLEKKELFGKTPKYELNHDYIYEFLDKKAEEEAIFVQKYREDLESEIKKYKKFVVTTAVMGKEVNKPFVEAIRNYAKRNNALLLVLPCEDVASRGKKADPLELSPELNDFRVIFKDTYLNNNLCLCAIKVSAKQITPLTGLDRMATTRNASIIVASPKVFLKYIPNMHYDIPLALMTTGAITENNYDTDMYMSKRTSMLAENDHTYGVVIVEVENDNIFHFRHAYASDYNSLTDLGIDYLSDGSIKELNNSVMVVGDSHVGYHDAELHEAVMELAENTNVSKVVLHDVFNGTSISHHDEGKAITKARKAEEGRLGLELECIAVKNYLVDIENRGLEIFLPEANHHKHLTRYLEEGRYVSDPINHKFSLKLAAKAVDGFNPLQYAVESLLNYKSDKVHWLAMDEPYSFYNVLVSCHGDKGSNGARGSIQAFNRGIGNCVIAHSHSAQIMRNTFCVGTVSKMNLGYNEGLSSWTRTCCLIYNNGVKQLINFIPNKTGYYTYRV